VFTETSRRCNPRQIRQIGAPGEDQPVVSGTVEAGRADYNGSGFGTLGDCLILGDPDAFLLGQGFFSWLPLLAPPPKPRRDKKKLERS